MLNVLKENVFSKVHIESAILNRHCWYSNSNNDIVVTNLQPYEYFSIYGVQFFISDK